jgi:hypothetical protein
MTDDEITGEIPFMPALGALFVALGLVAVLVAVLISDRGRDTVPVGTRMIAPVGYYPTIAVAGEWVTNPDGSRVCRLRTAIVRGMTFSRGLCEDWQGAVPSWGQQVPWLRMTRDGRSQVMIEGRWHP